MFILVTYDVSTVDRQGRRRLRKVARACMDYGQRVQNSVFECKLGSKEWVLLRSRLLSEMDPDQDSIRFYFLDVDIKMEHHGTKQPVDLEEPLVI